MVAMAFSLTARRRHSLLALLFLALLAGGWLLWSDRRPGVAPTPFNAQAWRQPSADGSNEPACVRSAMALDLIDNNALIGKSMQQVTELLGPADEQGKDYLTYHLGRCAGMGWDDSDLRLGLDGNRTQVLRATVEHVTVSESR